MRRVFYSSLRWAWDALSCVRSSYAHHSDSFPHTRFKEKRLEMNIKDRQVDKYKSLTQNEINHLHMNNIISTHQLEDYVSRFPYRCAVCNKCFEKILIEEGFKKHELGNAFDTIISKRRLSHSGQNKRKKK